MHLKHTVFLLADFIFNNTEQEVTLDLQDKWDTIRELTSNMHN